MPKIEKPRVYRKALTIDPIKAGEPRNWMESGLRAKLECGHERFLDFIDGKIIDVESGSWIKGKLTDWTGTIVKVGDEVHCLKCSSEAYLALLAARPAEKAERFETRAALLKAHPQAKWHEEGVIHKHEGRLYVQTYLGQHEWLAFNVDDVREVWSDPGWEGTEYGYAYVPEWHAEVAFNTLGTRGEIAPPERPGKPITGDMIMQAKPEKLKEYLEPGDPLRAALDLDKS